MNFLKKIPRPGLRTIKTGVAIFACMLLYNAVGMQDRAAFAIFAILMCMQDSVKKTVREGMDRIGGTLIGAIFAIVMIYFGVLSLPFLWYATVIAIGLIILIHLCYMLGLTSTIIMAYFTYFGIILATGENAVEMAMFRTLDTLVGIAIAYAVNVALFRPKEERRKEEKMEKKMNYEEAMQYLDTRIQFGMRVGLERIQKLMHHLGDPQNDVKYVHIAGTNGKGSTSSYCFHMLKEGGYKVGLFTSPYIQTFNERIQVGNSKITNDEVADILSLIRTTIEENFKDDEAPTWFEVITAMCFVYFSRQKCDIVVLEVGIGGILDSTNVIKVPEVAVITTINYDHMELLGETLEEIASKKAGIIKPGGLVVVYPQGESVMNVFREKCKAEGAEMIEVFAKDIEEKSYTLNGIDFTYKDYNLSTKMLGQHQMYNCSVAIQAMETIRRRGFNVSEQNIIDGVAKTTWPGRMEIVNKEPLLIIDGAHNIQGTENLAENLKIVCQGKKFVFIIGVLAGRDYKAILEPFLPIAQEFLTVTPGSMYKKGMPAEEFAEYIRSVGFKATACEKVSDAVEKAFEISKANESDNQTLPICAFGSLYYIGMVRDHLGLH